MSFIDFRTALHHEKYLESPRVCMLPVFLHMQRNNIVLKCTWGPTSCEYNCLDFGQQHIHYESDWSVDYNVDPLLVVRAAPLVHFWRHCACREYIRATVYMYLSRVVRCFQLHPDSFTQQPPSRSSPLVIIVNNGSRHAV